MAREKEGFRDQYRALIERFPGREAITMKEAAQVLSVSLDAIAESSDFPKKKIGRRVIVPLVSLARWMC